MRAANAEPTSQPIAWDVLSIGNSEIQICSDQLLDILDSSLEGSRNITAAIVAYAEL